MRVPSRRVCDPPEGGRHGDQTTEQPFGQDVEAIVLEVSQSPIEFPLEVLDIQDHVQCYRKHPRAIPSQSDPRNLRPCSGWMKAI